MDRFKELGEKGVESKESRSGRFREMAKESLRCTNVTSRKSWKEELEATLREKEDNKA